MCQGWLLTRAHHPVGRGSEQLAGLMPSLGGGSLPAAVPTRVCIKRGRATARQRRWGAGGEQGGLPALTGSFARSSTDATWLDVLAERFYARGTKPAGCPELLGKSRQHL